MSPGGTTKKQIDHFMIDSKIKHYITGVKSCIGVYGISDNFLVRVRSPKIDDKVERKEIVIQKFNVEKLKENQNLQNYKETINKNFKNVNNTELDQLCGNLEKSIEQAAKDVQGFEERRKPKKWFDDRCRRALEERDAARVALIKTPTSLTKEP